MLDYYIVIYEQVAIDIESSGYVCNIKIVNSCIYLHKT